MSKKFIYLVNLSKSVEEMKLPTKGLFWHRRWEELMFVAEKTLFKGLYYANKWLYRALKLKPATVLFAGLIAGLLVAIAWNL